MDLSALILLAAVVLTIWQFGARVDFRERRTTAIDASFRALRIPLGEHTIGTDEVRVVRRVEGVVSTEGFDSQFSLSGAYWYLVGPGPSYFVAIQSDTHDAGVFDVRWNVRPLSAERMRGALADDRKATAREAPSAAN